MIDFNPEMGRMAQAGIIDSRQRERLSSEAPLGDAIVRTQENKNLEKLAEMPSSVL